MKYFLFTLMFAFLVLPMNAQEYSEKGSAGFLDKCLVEVGVNAGFKNKGYAPLTMNANLGYHFLPRFYAFAKVEGTLLLYDKDGVKTYLKSQDLGGGLGVKLTNPKTCSDGIDFRVSLTNSIGNADWKHTTYNANIIWYSNHKNKRTTPYIGLGFKHINSHSAGIPNYNGIYVTVGFKF